METLFYVVLWRPQGSTIWTPMTLAHRPARNYFPSIATACDYISWLRADGHTTYLPGPEKSVPTEFVIGKVTLLEEPTQ